MKSICNLTTFILCLIGSIAFGQTTYTTSINASSPQNYSVNIEIVLTGIVPVQGTCDWGYNYDVAYDYDIEILGGSSNLYTLSGYLTCGSNQGIYFDLPNNGGSGSNTTQGNPWTNNTNCATATVESLLCDSVSLQIEGPGIANQTVTLTPTSNANGSNSEWDIHGNNADSTDFIGTINESDLRFRSNNSERMRITKDGNIGIGVSSPLEKFELNGSMKLSGDVIFSDYANMNDSLDKFLFVDQNGRTSAKTLDQLKNVLYAEPILTPVSYCDLAGVIQSPTWSNGANKIYSYCPQVNVGIGTNDPQKLLDVRGTTQTRNLEVGREISNYSLISGFRTGVTNTSILSLGQYDPQTQYEHVALDLKSSGELYLRYRNIQGSTTPATIFNIHTNGADALKVNEAGRFELEYLGYGPALIIRSQNANREILRLENHGLLRARRVKIDLDTWADFVFMEDYELMPLGELKNFLELNKHLPNVPSEEELQQDGLDVAEMNKILMQKIEELTLYIIEQGEKSEELEIKIEALQMQISELK